MKVKLKICTCCEQPRVIWKRVNGVGWCKDCWFKTGVKQSADVNNDQHKPKSYRPIPARSPKRQKEEIIYSTMRKVFLEQHPQCMINIPGVCSKRPANQIHHSYSGKDRDKYFLDSTTWFSTEDACHKWVHLNPIEARELGFLK